MRALSMSSADAFILVYDVTDSSTFDEARVIRDQIHETKVRRFFLMANGQFNQFMLLIGDHCRSHCGCR